ncbi:LysR family transcriptional regulator [Taklimakanibacter deserti]|uniref:LysR family transcriptional regulator n=1 Tax=Taklimakanibacter deserti TaxID=2267839 RepID=UPI000E64F4AF
METLANLESFIRSAELGSFSSAARQLGLTPAAVSRNVALLERRLGVRLFQRSTRKLALTQAGDRFFHEIGGTLAALKAAIARTATERGEPAGLLKVSMAPAFGITYLMPLLPDFLARYPLIRPQWHLENRPVDLVAEGFDAAIGGGFDLAPGIVSRQLAPAHLVAVASRDYLARHPPPVDPSDLARFAGIVMRSDRTGRVRHWPMRDAAGIEMQAALSETIVVNDPMAMREAALLDLGIALIAVPDVLAHLEGGTLIRVLPRWYVDAGSISIYFASRTLMPAKARVFVDFVAERFKRDRLAQRFAGSLG